MFAKSYFPGAYWPGVYFPPTKGDIVISGLISAMVGTVVAPTVVLGSLSFSPIVNAVTQGIPPTVIQGDAIAFGGLKGNVSIKYLEGGVEIRILGGSVSLLPALQADVKLN